MQKLADEIEKVQDRCLKLIYPDLADGQALVTPGLTKLQEIRENLTRDLLDEIKDHQHVLHSLLLFRDPNSFRSRNPSQMLFRLHDQHDLGEHLFRTVCPSVIN